jgi:NAD-dependent dihydropyrimidine dehydrogenase PreA subunit
MVVSESGDADRGAAIMIASTLSELTRDALQTGLRLVPWPTEPGLRALGNPGPLSPVLVTCNYDLTVRRVARAMRGVDAWLVVAPSSGINVWCAASGGHLSTHQVITALKTSGISQRVHHRRAILPQLAATGVIAREVERRSRWQVKFGPVYAQDIPRYLAQHEKKSEDMRRVRFGLRERLEMAASWATPMALVAAIPSLIFHPSWALPLIAMMCVLAVSVFTIYDRLPARRRLYFTVAAALSAVAATALAGGGIAALVTAALASVAAGWLLTYDYTGSTPIEGGSHFREARWHINLDLDRCKGVYFCWQVCPEACFDKREDIRKVKLARSDSCIRCGACVVQCPTDALYFQSATGRRIEPETIRRFKLNLLGQRSVEVGTSVGASGETSAGSDAV